MYRLSMQAFFFFVPKKYDIIPIMKHMIFALMGVTVILAGCRSSSNEVVVEQENITDVCAGPDCAIMRYASPSGNDLVVETAKHIIQIQAPAKVPYTYRVWAGDKSTTDDPDLIVQDGKAMVLVEE